MVKLVQVVCIPLAAIGVFTPQGERAAECIVEVPETAVVKTSDTGIALHHDDGSVEHVLTPAHCHTDDVAVALAQPTQTNGNGWDDYVAFTYDPGFSTFTGYNNIPDGPSSQGQTVYYFLGLQNLPFPGSGVPVSVLQPVLRLGEGSSWFASSWACCPSNITVQGPSIGPFEVGTRMYGSIARLDVETWQIDTQINGQISTLNAQIGPYAFNWASAALETYNIQSCDGYPSQPVTFDTIELTDETGNIINPSWTNDGGSTCGAQTTIQDIHTVTIQHNAGPTPPPPPPPPPSGTTCRCDNPGECCIDLNHYTCSDSAFDDYCEWDQMCNVQGDWELSDKGTVCQHSGPAPSPVPPPPSPSGTVTCRCDEPGVCCANHNHYTCSDSSYDSYCEADQMCNVQGDWEFPEWWDWARICPQVGENMIV